MQAAKAFDEAAEQGWAENSTPGIYRWNLPVFSGMANKAQVANMTFLPRNTGKYDFKLKNAADIFRKLT